MTGGVASSLYRGSVIHRRLRPRAHYLRYAMFYLLLDLDELPVLAKSLRLLGVERAAPLSFRAADHGDGGGDLRSWVADQLHTTGLHFDLAAVWLLTLPRIFGYVFNPISIYYCYDPVGDLRATIYEVNNTFGGRHAYVLPVATGADIIQQSCAKKLYVSPFNDVSGGYQFKLLRPGAKLALTIDQSDDDGPLLQASFAGRRSVLTDRQLLGVLLAYPFLTLKVIAGIHWEALKIWAKGVPLHKRPGSTDNPLRDGVGAGATRHVDWGIDRAELKAGARTGPETTA